MTNAIKGMNRIFQLLIYFHYEMIYMRASIIPVCTEIHFFFYN